MEIFDCWEETSRLITRGESARAIELCESKRCSNVLRCQRYLGWTYYAKGDIEGALIWFSKAANQGDAEASFGVASAYVARKEFQLALRHFEQAATAGYRRGYQWIAGIHQHGYGVPIDVDKAISYYEKGASYGYVMAERSLINLRWERGNLPVKLLSLLQLIRLQLRAAKIAYRDINDPRIADVNNAFAKAAKL